MKQTNSQSTCCIEQQGNSLIVLNLCTNLQQEEQSRLKSHNSNIETGSDHTLLDSKDFKTICWLFVTTNIIHVCMYVSHLINCALYSAARDVRKKKLMDGHYICRHQRV